jgi:hypothetical protein
MGVVRHEATISVAVPHYEERFGPVRWRIAATLWPDGTGESTLPTTHSALRAAAKSRRLP